MSADDHLGMQFDFAPANEDYPRHKVSFGHGELNWHPETGEITNLLVEGPYRGQGYATGMYHHAQEMSAEHGLPTPEHSGFRTPAGDAFAKSVGGHLPPLTNEAKAMPWGPAGQVKPKSERRTENKIVGWDHGG